ncbi:MAG: glutathione peroxidase [Hyphomicrobiales bacterium]|nr:MAG: glutathione peroxidase [Hyphomicrobiales bacterium]
MPSISDFSATRLLGGEEALSTYAGKVVLVVNVASGCGFTPQYVGLEKLWRDYGDKGLVVLGFPCNQFGAQEAGSADEIATFCTTIYDVTFPLFAKVDVNGKEAHPLFHWLRDAAPGILGFNDVKWNFTKFLIGRDGQAVRRFSPDTEPAAIAKDIEALL